MNKTALQGPVRVRFAPSPTGYLHVGGARTALYNQLLARSLGGEFILRIEDTDRQRSDAAMTDQILSSLDWLGCHWDEGPFHQADGLERHQERAQDLLASGAAYRCFCTLETIAEQRTAAEKAGERFQYPRTCLQLAPEEVEAKLAAELPFVIRLRMPDEPIIVHDLVRGDVEFPPEAVDDFIILRSDGTPTYHLSVVSDDIDMGVTLVVRGEDHLSNTPKHIVLFEGLGAELPQFGHLPLILGPNRKRLSKRTGATSVEEFRDQGILPQALYNHLALLGWSPGDDRELMTQEEMIAAFTVERLNDSAAVFDYEKLAWINGRTMSSLPYEDLLPHLTSFLEGAGLADADPERLQSVVDLLRTRATTLQELADRAQPYFADKLDYDPDLCAKFWEDADLKTELKQLTERLAALDPWTEECIETTLRACADDLEVKAGRLIHPVRAALTNAKAGPSLFALVEVMGQKRSVKRLGSFLSGWAI